MAVHFCQLQMTSRYSWVRRHANNLRNRTRTWKDMKTQCGNIIRWRPPIFASKKCRTACSYLYRVNFLFAGVTVLFTKLLWNTMLPSTSPTRSGSLTSQFGLTWYPVSAKSWSNVISKHNSCLQFVTSWSKICCWWKCSTGSVFLPSFSVRCGNVLQAAADRLGEQFSQCYTRERPPS